MTRCREPELWRAVFATDFSSVEILDSSDEVVVLRFALKARLILFPLVKWVCPCHLSLVSYL